MKISILLPTRKRGEMLRHAVDSLFAHAAKPDNLEIILRVDDNDPTDYTYWRNRSDTVVLGGPRYGYKGMHLYYDETCRAAKHPWLLVWNDDLLMKTDRWDELLLSDRPDKLHVQFLKRDCYSGYDPEKPYQDIDTAYPAFPKLWFDITGRISCNAHCDSWLDYVSETLKVKTFRHDIIVHHDRPEDETAHERVFDWDAFQNTENVSSRADDVAKLVAYLEANPQQLLV